MDLLPKQMCHRCSYKLEEFYNFYVECAKTDTELKSQLSWMRKENLEEKIITPMVKMNRFKIKTEPPDNNVGQNGVIDHISESSLLFPGSILHSFDWNSGPMLSCSKCQCLNNASIKVNKTSPKQVKTTSPVQSENEPHSSNVMSNTTDKVCEFNEPTDINKSSNSNANSCENNNFKEANSTDTSVTVNLDSDKVKDIPHTKISKAEKLNRALRPRKGSVDYIGPKRKSIANLKAKFKSKLEMFNPSLVNPVNIQISQSNIHPTPIIKLEKLDDSMRSLRVRKNLEEFNKRIKEFQMKKKLNKGEKILQRAENLGKKILLRDENLIRKSLQKEDNSNRKSLQEEESFGKKNLQKDGNLGRKSMLKGENSNRKSLHKEENINIHSMLCEENVDKNNSENEKNECGKDLLKEGAEEKKTCVDDNQGITILEVKHEEIKQSVNTSVSKSENMVTELNIKQEDDKTIKNHNNIDGQIIQIEDDNFHVNLSKDQKAPKPTDRHPLCAVVKLEKDYTCNVDYPRIKIKRHLTVANSSKPQNDAMEDAVKQKNLTQSVNKKIFSKTNGISSAKNLKSTEKRFKGGVKSGKVCKKKDKQMNLVNMKQIILKKNSSVLVLPHSDLKHYCEECDTSFKNRELYQLHPCYQK